MTSFSVECVYNPSSRSVGGGVHAAQQVSTQYRIFRRIMIAAKSTKSVNLAIEERWKWYFSGPRSDCDIRRKGQSVITRGSLRAETFSLIRTLPKARTWNCLNPKLTRPKNTDTLQKGKHIAEKDPPSAAMSSAKLVCKPTTLHMSKRRSDAGGKSRNLGRSFEAHCFQQTSGK